MILRSVHSAVNHTPTHLLKEIILVDDNSDEGMGVADQHRLLGEEDADSQYPEGEMPLHSFQCEPRCSGLLSLGDVLEEEV